nr:MAG TPA: hypothetical protein [Caudoviricetes sp.]
MMIAFQRVDGHLLIGLVRLNDNRLLSESFLFHVNHNLSFFFIKGGLSCRF